MTLDQQVVASIKCLCGAQQGAPCVTRHGNERAVPHPVRVNRYKQMVELWLSP